MIDLETAAPSLVRRLRQYKDRPTAYYRPSDGGIIVGYPQRQTYSVERHSDLADVLAALAPHITQLYVVGGNMAADTPSMEWFKGPVVDGWTIERLQPEPRIAVYAKHRRRITVRTSAPFWGEETNLWTLHAAHYLMGDELRTRFDDHATLLGTPAATGLDLLERSLPFGKSFPIIDEAHRTTLRANFGQGRLESLTLPSIKRIPGLYTYDARWMYAACLAHLPVGEVEYTETHGGNGHFLGYRNAFYEVDFRIPGTWSHIGLLSTLDERTGRPYWPSEAGAGWFRTWAGSPTLGLALANGWEARIRKTLAFSPEKGSPDPAAVWLGKLKTLRYAYSGDTSAAGELVARATRHLVIDTIGAWYRMAREVLHVTPLDDAGSVPESAITVDLYDDRIEWTSYEPLTAQMMTYQHPEWSCMVWERSRARLARFALTLPRESLISARNDALAVSTIPAGLTDDGKIGTFREKREPGTWIDHEVKAPHSESDFQTLRARIKAGRA